MGDDSSSKVKNTIRCSRAEQISGSQACWSCVCSDSVRPHSETHNSHRTMPLNISGH